MRIFVSYSSLSLIWILTIFFVTMCIYVCVLSKGRDKLVQTFRLSSGLPLKQTQK